jgi:hypothetical protein
MASRRQHGIDGVVAGVGSAAAGVAGLFKSVTPVLARVMTLLGSFTATVGVNVTVR